jgi:septal ring-binding cell division protein DamX/type II secretory pathway predicted ATPase ExeA
MNQFADMPESSLADAYIQRLGLSDDPFVIETDYFYGGGMRRQILEQVIHFSRFGEQPVLLTGSTGSGTSRILDELFVQLQQTMDCCDINGAQSPSPEQILEELNQQLQFQLPQPVSVANFLLALEHNREMTEDDEPLLIAIDQAHFLSVESLEMLYELFEDAAGTVRLLLVGEYQLEQLVGLAGFAPEQLKSLELGALNTAEIGEYILGLLISVGYTGEQLPLSSDQLAVLQEQSGGNIAEINRLAPLLLSEQPHKSTQGLKSRLPVVHLVTIGVLALVLVPVYLYNGADSGSVDEVVDSSSVAVNGVSVVNDAIDDSGDNEAVKRVTKTFDVLLPTEIEDVDADADADVNEGKGSIDRQGQAVSDAVRESSTLQAKSKAIAEVPKEQSVVVVTEVQDSPIINKPAAVKATSTPVVNASEALEPKPVAPSVIEPREQRLLDMPTANYMLQLMGGLDEQRVRDFVKKYIAQLPLTYFETRLNGKPWFVVVTGSYPDKVTAVAAIQKLPAELQRQKPWARSVSSIQADIKNR